jgi:DinB family protein
VIKDHNARNRAARERLDALIARLGESQIEIDDGWSGAGLLAHLAFWDRLAAKRLDKYLRDREPPVVTPDALIDLINGAGMRQWMDTPARVAAAQVRDAAAALDRLIETLPADALAALVALDRPLLIDRSIHRKEHLDQIERALR